MQRAHGKTLSLIVAIVASISWLAGCAQQQMAHPPAVPSAGSPSATGQTSSTSGAESAPSSTSGTSSSSGTSSDSGSSAEEEGSETTGAGAAAQTPDEKRDGLDRTLQASLGAFDAMLLKEQVEAAARRAEHGTGAGAGTGSGAGGEGEGSGEGEGGGGAGSSGSGAGATGSEASTGEKRSGGQDKEARGTEGKGGGGDKDRSTGSSGARQPREGGRVVTGDPEGTPPGGADDARVPEDVGDGRDDDVVARQLREAAMSEEDPAIREKLWDEYRRYKRGES